MPELYGQDVRMLLLDVIAEQGANINRTAVFDRIVQRLNPHQHPNGGAFMLSIAEQRIVLTEWDSLFRSGYLATGHDLTNPDPPRAHLTAAGAVAMQSRARDPINPAAYMAHVDEMAELDDISRRYLEDALRCFEADVAPAAAVMLGAAAERLVLNIRDKILARIQRGHGNANAQLNDWRVRTIMTGIETYMNANQGVMDHPLREAFDAQWPAFAQQIRAARNEAGHPQGLNPINRETAHAGFLVFPELASVATRLGDALDA